MHVYAIDDLLISCTRPVGDGATVDLTLRGPLVLDTAGRLRAVLSYVLDDGARRINVDLAGITDVDPAGLASLIIAARQLEATSGFSITAISSECTDVMRRLHLFDGQLTPA